MDPATPSAVDDASGDDRHAVTLLLRAWQAGDPQARERLMNLVYDRVHAIAAQSLRRAPNAALATTDLAHEALIRLLQSDASWSDRQHFFNVVACATRQVLVDSARRRLADKRGAGAEAVSLSAADGVALHDSELLRVDDAMAALAIEDERRARVVELTYFGGFGQDEIAAALDISVRTVVNDLRFARAWLKAALQA